MPNSRPLDCHFFSLVRLAMPGRWLLAAIMIGALLLPCLNSPSSARAIFTPLNPGVRNDPTQLNFTPVCNAQLTGTIDPGDYELLKPKVDMFMADPRVAPIVSAIRAQMEAFSTNPFNTDLKLIDRQFYALCLSSKGGDLKEARRLAALFDGWIMVVGLDRQGNAQECASACAVLFMQGKRRDGIFTSNEYKRYPGRYLHYKSRLGFHAPRLEFPAGTQKVSVAEAEQAYVAALTSVQELLQDAPSDYFHEDNKRRGEDFPDDLILRLLTTPPAMMHWVETMQEAVQWGIEVYGVAPPPALTDRHLMLACANVAYKRCNQLRTLDRCADEFAVKSTELNFARIGAFKLPQSGAAGTRAAEIDKIKAMTATWAPRLVPIMQPTGNANGVSIEGVLFEHKSPQFGSKQYPCGIVATWHRNQLINLEIQTFNGPWTDWLRQPKDSPQMNYSVEELAKLEKQIATGLYRADSANHLRLTRLLLPNNRLTELGQDPWSGLDAGTNMFGRPLALPPKQ